MSMTLTENAMIYHNLEDTFSFAGTPQELADRLQQWAKREWTHFFHVVDNDSDGRPKNWPTTPYMNVVPIAADGTPYRIEYILELPDIDSVTGQEKEYPKRIPGLILELTHELSNHTTIRVECRHPECEPMYYEILKSCGKQVHLHVEEQLETNSSKSQPHSAPPNSLTMRQIEVASLLAEGKNDDEIRRDLFITMATVRSHRKNIKEKWEMSTQNISKMQQEARRRGYGNRG
jgi:DNA-binding CsgD family transcriptional regulator